MMERQVSQDRANRMFDHYVISSRRAVDYANADECGPAPTYLTMNFVIVSFDHQPAINILIM